MCRGNVPPSDGGFWYHSLAPDSVHIRGFAIISWQQTPRSAEEVVPQSTLRQQKKSVMAVRGCSEPKYDETDCRQNLLTTKGLTVSKPKCFARASMRPTPGSGTQLLAQGHVILQQACT